MAITRRQFVTRLGTLAAAMGVGQSDLSKVVDAFAHGSVWTAGGWTNKPKVVWVHGAECTGCSTSLLSLFEQVQAPAVETRSESILAALDLAVGGDGNGDKVLYGDTVLKPNPGHPFGHRTLQNTDYVAGCDFESENNAGGAYVATIADVLIDFIALEYHETVMGMGGDLAYKWLKDIVDNGDGASSNAYVLVVEGAIQPFDGGGYWQKPGTANTSAPWCSIGMSEKDNGSGKPVGEHSFDEVVAALASHDKCQLVVPIGQCACFGGYPAAVSPTLGGGMTGALGTEEFLKSFSDADIKAAANKVVTVPGCPTNPWWFVLTVVAWLVDFTNASRPLGILMPGVPAPGKPPALNPAAIDGARRLKAVYGQPLHGSNCKRYQDFLDNNFAAKPGDAGCLKALGCKGPVTMTLCGAHGWNAQNPRNAQKDGTLDNSVGLVNKELVGQNVGNNYGGNCVVAGHPCMGCTEKGYPDQLVPFVAR